MIFLKLLTWPYVRKHKLRSLLTLFGIVLGVAVFVGMHTANRTVSRAFNKTVDRIAGAAQLQVSAGETGFPEEALEKVQSLIEVQAAAPVIEAVLNTGLKGQGNLLVLGVDMTGDRNLRDYDLEGQDDDVIDDPLVFLAQPDSLILSKPFADKNGIQRNQKITLETMIGPRQFTVRGIMKPTGLAGAFGGNLAIMDIYAAQMIFGRGRLFDRIDIGVTEGVTVEECRRKIASLLGPGYEVAPPSSRGEHFESISRGLSISINITSLFALLIGVFIIYNSFSIAITQRRSEIGILRAMGASERQVLTMFLGESAVAGIIGSFLGIWLGLGMARAIAPQLSYLVSEVYGAAQVTDVIETDSTLLVTALIIGVVASILGGLLPARSASAVDPVRALQKGRYQVLGEGENRLRRRGALVLLLAAALALMTGAANNLIFYAGYVVCVLAIVLLSPALSLRLARAIRPLWRKIRPVEGALAADSLIQAPRRTSATISALMLSLAMAVGFSGVAAGIYTSVLEWMDNTLNPDLFVAPGESVTQKGFRFPGSMSAELAAIPGIEEAHPVRDARVLINGVPAMAVAVDIDHVQRRVKPMVVEGNAEEMLRLAKAGQGVILSDSLARIRGFHKGDTIEINTPTGPLRLPILGTTIDYSDQQGSFLMDRSVYLHYWKDDTANIFRVYLRKGTNPEKVRQAIYERFSDQRRLFVFTNDSLRKYVLDTTAQWFGLTYIQLAVALLVAVLGIVNTLTVSITDRRRELGVLQAVGALRRQVRGTVWMEAVAIGLIGVILGCALGAVMLFYNLDMIGRDMAGLRISYEYPIGFALALFPVIVGAALLAAIWPGEAAVRASLVESLEYE